MRTLRTPSMRRVAVSRSRSGGRPCPVSHAFQAAAAASEAVVACASRAWALPFRSTSTCRRSVRSAIRAARESSMESVRKDGRTPGPRTTGPRSAAATPTTSPTTAPPGPPNPISSALSPAVRPTSRPTRSQVNEGRRPAAAARSVPGPTGVATSGAMDPGVAIAASSALASLWFWAAVLAAVRAADRSRSTASSSVRNCPEIAPCASRESSTPATRASSQPGPSRRTASATEAERSARSRSRSTRRARSPRASASSARSASAVGRAASSRSSTATLSRSRAASARSALELGPPLEEAGELTLDPDDAFEQGR